MFTPDGESLVGVEARNESRTSKAVHWISRGTGEETGFLDVRSAAEKFHEGDGGPEIGDVYLSPDGRWVAAQHYLGDPVLLHLWDGRTGKWKYVEPSSESWFCVDAATFSADGKLLVFASGTDGGGTKALDRMETPTKRRLSSIELPGYSVQRLALSADKRRLAAVTFGGAQVFAHQRGPVETDVPELEVGEEPGPIAFRPDGTELAILCGDEVLFWDGTAAEAERVVFSAGGLLSLCFSPDGRFLVLGCYDHTVRVWECATGRERHRFDWQIGPVEAVTFAPDGMTCAAGGANGQIVVWDVND
jgi:WD40 repeat protein